jgi:hypothetical protein
MPTAVSDPPRPGFAARLSTATFVAVCIVASLVGAAALFVLAALAVGIWDAIFSIETQPYEPVFALIFTAVGATLPIVILRNKRNKHRLPRFAKNPAPTEPPPLPDSPRLQVNTTYGDAELKEAATATAPSPTSAGQPQSPAGAIPTEDHRQHTQDAIVRPVRPVTAPVSQTNQRPYVGEFWQTARPGLRSLKQLLIIVGVIVAAILVVSIILSSNGPKLKVQARVGSLSIQNVGSEPITIRHLSVNDRPDCKIERPPIDLLVAPPGEARTLKVGDAADWIVYCSIVRLTVETDRGTATYTFD